MSPNVGNFVHDLVEMAKAMEELPHVQAALTESEREANRLAQSVQAREESILRLKAEIDALHAKVRSTEAERDDAELRFLESDERTHKALEFIKSGFGAAGSLIQALEPPAQVEPVVEATPIEPKAIDNPLYDDPQAPQGQSAVDPTTPTNDGASVGNNTSLTASVPQNTFNSEGMAAPATDPTAAPILNSPMSGSEGSGLDTSVPNAASPSTEGAKPYANKRYVDHPVYVALIDWLAGGGTEAAYYAR
jgi:hypothetical protein